MPRVITVLLGSILVTGCQAAGDDGIDTPLDPNVAPVTEGDWYRPAVSTTWQWQLLGQVNPAYAVEVYDIDLFDSPASLIADLQDGGKKVVCYFSAGSSEDWRPDFSRFLSSDIGKVLDDWEGERWLDIRSAEVHAIMLERLDLAVEKGCDGVEPDNLDGYSNPTGFDLNETDQRAYNRFIGNQAHLRGLTVALKNDGGQAGELVDYFDFELNEECHRYQECAELAVFTDNHKPIFNAEYAQSKTQAESLAQTVCSAAREVDIRTLILPLELDDSFRVSCD